MTETDYSYPERPATRARGRRRLLVLAAIVVLLLGGGTWWLVDHLAAKAAECPGTPGQAGDGHALSRRAGDGQCIGWLVDLPYAFGSDDTAMSAVVKKIVDENQRVARTGEPYVRVAVLMPMTAKPDSKLAAGPIVHAIEGAYTAQARTNAGITAYGDPKPLVQLVLANVGADQASWPDVVTELGGLTTGEHPLVAVTGMGVSVPQTRDAAKQLNARWHLPSIGSVLTSDDMTTRETGIASDKPGLFKVSPSNHAYVEALAGSLGTVATGFLVRDRNHDNYVQTLGAAFVDVFASLSLNNHQAWFNGSTPPSTGSTGLFQDAVNSISIEDPSVVFYAGRDADLPRLVRSLKFRRGPSAGRQLVLATGITGLVITPGDQPGADAEPLNTQDLLDAKVTIVAASSTDPEGWAEGIAAPAQYNAFVSAFTTGSAGFPKADLADGYAIMHHDAVAAAVTAIHSVYSQKQALPGPADIRDQLTAYRDTPIRGAAGDFYWTEQQPANDLWPIGRPVPVLTFPAASHQSAPYKTQCQTLGDPQQLDHYRLDHCAG
ncbi:hypothetical protein [Amycolatopsis sp. lyj-23]|uniref:hypothetical protein n=1 Tax=Amycolatopsis sp. lyj-23 TaxID=2789283 RepID=UPI00397D9CDA